MWISNAVMYVTVPYNKVLFSTLYFLTSQSEVDFGIALVPKTGNVRIKQYCGTFAYFIMSALCTDKRHMSLTITETYLGLHITCPIFLSKWAGKAQSV